MYERAQIDGNDAKREIARSHSNPAQDVNKDSELLYMDGSLVKNLDSTERMRRVRGYHKLGTVPCMVGRAEVCDAERFMIRAALAKRLRFVP
jgi:hypothetical protein